MCLPYWQWVRLQNAPHARDLQRCRRATSDLSEQTRGEAPIPECHNNHVHPPSTLHIVRRAVLIALSVVVGALTVVQSRVNGNVGLAVDDGLVVAWLSFTTSLTVTAVTVVCVPTLRAAVKRLRLARRRDANGRRRLPAWQLLGGLGGALFVTAQGITVPLLGVAVFTVAVVAGQNANSLVVDRLGFGPAGQQPITVLRVGAAVVATAGVTLAVSGQLGSATFSIVGLVLTVVAGAAIAAQQAVNARVGAIGETTWAGALVNFGVGWLAVSAVLVIQRSLLSTAPLPQGWFHPWMLSGGLLGLMFILVATVAVAELGVLTFGLLSIAGQMICALAFAALQPSPQAPFDWTLVLGVLITGVAVAVANADKAKRRSHAQGSAAAI